VHDAALRVERRVGLRLDSYRHPLSSRKLWDVHNDLTIVVDNAFPMYGNAHNQTLPFLGA
jgi:hypothetical protein